MDRILAPPRPDVAFVTTAPRPTPPPVRVPFAQVFGGGAQALVRGAEAAVTSLPGGPVMAVAVRGGAQALPTMGPRAAVTPMVGPAAGGVATAMLPGSGVAPTAVTGLAPAYAVAEGPGGALPSPGAGVSSAEGGLEASLGQAQQMNLYYLQIQEAVNAQNRSFTTLSNVLKAEHDTVKTAIGNIR